MFKLSLWILIIVIICIIILLSSLIYFFYKIFSYNRTNLREKQIPIQYLPPEKKIIIPIFDNSKKFLKKRERFQFLMHKFYDNMRNKLETRQHLQKQAFYEHNHHIDDSLSPSSTILYKKKHKKKQDRVNEKVNENEKTDDIMKNDDMIPVNDDNDGLGDLEMGFSSSMMNIPETDDGPGPQLSSLTRKSSPNMSSNGTGWFAFLSSHRSLNSDKSDSISDTGSETRSVRFMSKDRIRRRELRKTKLRERFGNKAVTIVPDNADEPKDDTIPGVMDNVSMRRKDLSDLVSVRKLRREERKIEDNARGIKDPCKRVSGPPKSMTLFPPNMQVCDHPGDLSPEKLLYRRAYYKLHLKKVRGWYPCTIVAVLSHEDANYRIKFDRSETQSTLVDGSHDVRFDWSGKNGYGLRWVLLEPIPGIKIEEPPHPIETIAGVLNFNNSRAVSAKDISRSQSKRSQLNSNLDDNYMNEPIDTIEDSYLSLAIDSEADLNMFSLV